jgi:hypothetical protein
MADIWNSTHIQIRRAHLFHLIDGDESHIHHHIYVQRLRSGPKSTNIAL